MRRLAEGETQAKVAAGMGIDPRTLMRCIKTVKEESAKSTKLDKTAEA